MIEEFRLFPEAATNVAGEIDALYLFLVVTTGAVVVGIALTVLYLAVKYRRRPGNEIPEEYHPSPWLEVAWIVIPFGIFCIYFLWGAKVFFTASRPPDNALEVYATGKQWMWKFQHLGGQSEINELHVPVGRPVRIIMTSEDVIHDFYVPAFRVHMDVIPNRYTTYWFEATKTGSFHLFCSEYCGTDHSGMIGKVHVMDPDDYQLWLSGGGSEGTPAAEGKKIFEKYACATCHLEKDGGRGPTLVGVFGRRVSLQGGSAVMADENYLRESVLNPQAKIVAGYDPIMPTFQGQLSEAQIMQLVAYLKSLKTDTAAPATALPAPVAATTPANPAPTNPAAPAAQPNTGTNQP